MSITIERSQPIVSVDMPGGVWTAKEFVVFDQATIAQLCESVKRLNRLNLCSQWALGDLGIAIQERRRAEVQREIDDLMAQAKAIEGGDAGASEHRSNLLAKAKKLENAPVEYTRELAEVLGVDEGHWWNCVTLARFYPPSFRDEALPPKHHLVAMQAARREVRGGAHQSPRPEGTGRATTNPGEQARVWLREAAQHGLSASELRRRVNTALRTVVPPKAAPEPDAYAALTAADEWAVTYRASVPALTKDQRTRILTMMQGLLDLADALRD